MAQKTVHTLKFKKILIEHKKLGDITNRRKKILKNLKKQAMPDY